MKKFTINFLAIAMFFLMGTYVMAQTQYEITFQVDMTEADPFDPATDDVYISGNFAGWATPGSDITYKMEPLEVGSMIYTLTATIDSCELLYKYFRIIDGAATWDNGEWNGDPNRKVYITETATLENVWANKPYDITFNVDMTNADPYDPTTDSIYIGGSLANGWAVPGTISAYMMHKSDTIANTYTITLLLYKGDYQFKFFRCIDNVPSFDNGEWEGDPNREVTTDTIAAVFNYNWGVNAGIFDTKKPFSYTMYPNPVTTSLNLFNISDATQIDVYDITGKLVRTLQLELVQDISIDVAELQSGVYIVSVFNNTGVQTTKFVKN